MSIPFSKNTIPGPESEIEKRSIEVDSMMHEWYKEEGEDSAGRVAFKRGGWLPLLFFVYGFCSGDYGRRCAFV